MGLQEGVRVVRLVVGGSRVTEVIPHVGRSQKSIQVR